jgi:hypothetical protein
MISIKCVASFLTYIFLAQVLAGSIPVTIINDNSKYSGLAGSKKAGPPPGRKLAGTIDVIGGNPGSSRRTLDGKPVTTTPTTPTPEPQENPIQVNIPLNVS